MLHNFIFIGHRGTRVKFDENTYKAFDKAIEWGANFIETDVRKTLDQKLILMHDETVDRTTTGKGQVRKMEYNQIKKLKTLRQAEKIPLLMEMLEKYKNKTKIIIDLKEEDILNDILKVIRKFYYLKNNIIISGRVLNDLLATKKEFPEIKLCYNITKAKKNNLDDFLKHKIHNSNLKEIDLINLRSELITSEFIRKCHERRITPLAWDFLKYGKKGKRRIKSLVKMGIRGILFDDYHNILEIKAWIKKTKFV